MNRTSRRLAQNLLNNRVQSQAPARPLVECLESRTLLSGTVSASVVNGTLIVHGDAARNAIILDQTGLNADQVRLTGTGDTKINKEAGPIVLNGVKRNVVVRMGANADDVTLRDVNLPGSVAIEGRGGADTLTLSNVRVASNLNITSGAKGSTTAIGTVTIGKDLTVRGGAGGQNVSFLSVHVKRNTVVTSGRGASLLTVDDSTFDGFVRVTAGAAADVVRIDSLGAPDGPQSRFGRPVAVSLNAGKDTLQLGVLGQTGNGSTFAGAVRFSGGPGFDTLQNFDASTYNAKPKLRVVAGFESKIRTFETVAPTVSSTTPSDAATGVARNRKILVTFSEVMDPSTITAANVNITGPGNVPVTGTVDYVGTTMTFTPATTLAAGTAFTVTVTTGAKDLVGNPLAGAYTSTFTTGATSDTTAPAVISTDPSGGAAGVPLNKQVAATFSEAMNPLTITTATVTLSATGSGPVSGSVAYAGTTATFTPASPLAANTTYTMTVTTGVKDLAGNPLAGSVARSFTTGSTVDTTAPTVVSTNPADLGTNVAINKTVAAAFIEAMDATSITTATFTLIGPGHAAVAGTAGYDAASNTATFKPTSSLAPNTTYTATIAGGAGGAKDLAGNRLLLNKTWSFTTGTQAAQAPVNLGAAGSFAVLATASISGTGATVINGDVGLNPGSAQGIPPAQVNGTIHVDDQAVIKAQADLLAAYNDAVSRSVTSVSLPGNMGGLTFTPGLYTNSTSVLIQGSGPANDVTLDAQGDPNAIFIFKIGSTLTTGPGAHVVLAGGAKASNVFWQVGTSATLDTTTIFKGNVMAAVTITVNSGSAIEGRLLAGSNSDGSVTINASTVTVPTA
jgi:hypothetical protein